ncbi:unnamed protein product, partial [Pylaiella littoralis]
MRGGNGRSPSEAHGSDGARTEGSSSGWSISTSHRDADSSDQENNQDRKNRDNNLREWGPFPGTDFKCLGRRSGRDERSEDLKGDPQEISERGENTDGGLSMTSSI